MNNQPQSYAFISAVQLGTPLNTGRETPEHIARNAVQRSIVQLTEEEKGKWPSQPETYLTDPHLNAELRKFSKLYAHYITGNMMQTGEQRTNVTKEMLEQSADECIKIIGREWGEKILPRVVQHIDKQVSALEQRSQSSSTYTR